jgi:hypothetical protein
MWPSVPWKKQLNFPIQYNWKNLVSHTYLLLLVKQKFFYNSCSWKQNKWQDQKQPSSCKRKKWILSTAVFTLRWKKTGTQQYIYTGNKPIWQSLEDLPWWNRLHKKQCLYLCLLQIKHTWLVKQLYKITVNNAWTSIWICTEINRVHSTEHDIK